MSSSRESRVVWTCPECSRNFRIPKSKPRPKLCVKCAKQAKSSSVANEPDLEENGDLYFQEAEAAPKSSLKFGVVTQRAGETAAPSSPRPEPPRAESGASVEELSERIDEILEHLEGITRTMKLVRWVMWGLGAATVLSVVVTAGGLLYSMSMMGSLTDLLNQPVGGLEVGELPAEGGQVENVGGREAQIPPGLREKLKPIEDYSNQLNELLDEVNQ